MNLEIASENLLSALHEAIRSALADDDATASGSRPFEVRATSGWKKQADELEAEMENRKLTFDHIDWRRPR